MSDSICAYMNNQMHRNFSKIFKLLSPYPPFNLFQSMHENHLPIHNAKVNRIVLMNVTEQDTGDQIQVQSQFTQGNYKLIHPPPKAGIATTWVLNKAHLLHKLVTSYVRRSFKEDSLNHIQKWTVCVIYLGTFYALR